jgi:hypothetical protein
MAVHAYVYEGVHAYVYEEAHTYVYEELAKGEGQDEIRLLKLLPGVSGAPLRCEIRKTNFSQCPAYEALSYVWGDQTKRNDIILQGHEFTVTRNLFDALQRLRLSTETRILWVDAICINQESVPERNHQIQLMRSIYENAACVLIYIGEPSVTQYDNGLSMMPQLLQAVQAAKDKGLKLRPEGLVVHDFSPENLDDLNPRRFAKNLEMLGLPHPVVCEQAYKAFGEILKRPWFERVWILQEVAVSKSAKVMYGDKSVPWDDFANAVSACGALGVVPTHINPLDASPAELIAVLQREFRHGQRLGLLTLLIAFRHCKATDPRDMVYALCGLVGQGTPNIMPDYSLHVTDVYKRVAAELLKGPYSLDITQVPRPLSSSISPSLPSWCPDWSSGYTFSESFLPSREDSSASTKYRFNASSGTRPSIMIDESLSLLTLDRMYYDEIAALAEPLREGRLTRPERHDSSLGPRTPLSLYELFLHLWPPIGQNARAQAEMQMVLAGWEEMANLKSRSAYPTGEGHADVFRRTLTADYALNGQEIQKREFQEWLRRAKLASHMAKIKSAIIFFTTILAIYAVHKLTRRQLSSNFSINTIPAAGRRLARTRKGYLGLVPDNTEPKDEIWLVKGAHTPLVLRRSVIERPDIEGTYHILVGASYVHGIMYGDAFDERRCERVQLR